MGKPPRRITNGIRFAAIGKKTKNIYKALQKPPKTVLEQYFISMV